MVYHLFHYAMLAIGELQYVRAMCLVLKMRDNRVYIAVALASAFGFRILRDFLPAQILGFGPFQVLHFFLAIACIFVFPIWYSAGPLSTRIFRSGLVNLSLTLADAMGGALYSLLANGSYRPAEINADSIPTMAFVYALVLPVNALFFEATIRFCSRRDQSETSAFPLSFITLVSVSLALVLFVDERVFAMNSLGASNSILLLLFGILSLMIGYAMVYVTHRDVMASRAIAERAATARQVKHLRHQVESAARRSVSVRRLRHDLANQVDVVHELATSGALPEADRYLATLQEQARGLE